MSPSRTHGKTGNFIIQRVYPNVGEIRRSSGTPSIRAYNNRLAILDKLNKLERWDVLRAFKDGDVTMEQLVEADAADRLGASLSDVKLRESLWAALGKALPKMGKAKSTRDNYGDAIVRFTKIGAPFLPANPTVGDLLKVDYDALYDAWGASNANWMHMKIMLSAFASKTMKDKFDPFCRSLRQLIPAKKPKKRQPKCTFADFRKIVNHTPEHARRSYWALLVTGMRKGEYLRCDARSLNASTLSIDVPGTKTEGSEAPLKVDPRLWHIVVEGIPSRLRYKMLRQYWAAACVAEGKGKYVADARTKSGLRYTGLTLHDIRHLHGQYAIDAGVAESKGQASYRH